jgi:hypothetical protein
VAYNLTNPQKDLLRWMVQENRAGRLLDEFHVHWLEEFGGLILEYQDQGDYPQITQGALDSLEAAGLLIGIPNIQTRTSQSGTVKKPKFTESRSELGRRVVITARAAEAVDSDFDAPDESFMTQLTPLSDTSNLDDELNERCLPPLMTGSSNPKMWDTSVRTAVVILEERLRDVGGIADSERIGRGLVNDVFGANGSMAGRFTSSERDGYRDLYSGIVGVFRNVYAHRIVDPTPEEAGAFIVFVNLLLKRLEDLREEAER